MQDLIDRLEKATGPDRSLDQAIALIAFPDCELWSPELWSGGPNEYIKREKPELWYDQILHYTQSMDAAMSLLPASFWGSIEWAGTTESHKQSWPLVKLGTGDIRLSAQANTLPLTICIAALKAKAAAHRIPA